MIIFDIAKDRFHILLSFFVMTDGLLQVFFYSLLVHFQRMIQFNNSVAFGFMTADRSGPSLRFLTGWSGTISSSGRSIARFCDYVLKATPSLRFAGLLKQIETPYHCMKTRLNLSTLNCQYTPSEKLKKKRLSF